MINHARTLLLNRRPGLATDPGEELVPSDFQPLSPLPSVIRKVFGVLFGADPDRLMLNYRLAQLMPVLHTIELAEFVLAYDPRITYWPPREDRLFKEAFHVDVIERLAGSGELTPIGTVAADENAGRTQFKWRVDVTSDSTVNVQTLTNPRQSQISEYTVTEGRSSLIRLVGSSLQFNFTGPVGSSWYVHANARPQRSTGDLLASLKEVVTAADDRILFGLPATGNRATWQALWREHPYYAYQLGGLLLGVIDYLEQRR